MADILLQKPTSNQNMTITPQSEDRLLFGFDVSDATFNRENDNLVISFVDGSSLTLDAFYEAYTVQNMPKLIMDHEEVDAESFFAALGEELMPAAGVAGTVAQGSGSGVDTLAGTLLGGINRLDGLDQEYPENADEEQSLEAIGEEEGDGADTRATGDGSGENPDDTAGTTPNPDDTPDSTPEGTPETPQDDGGTGTKPEPNPNPAPDESTSAPQPTDLKPTAHADEKSLAEGSNATGNLLDNDEAGDGGESAGKVLESVTPPAGWEAVTEELCQELGVDWERFEDTFTFYDPSTNEVLIVQKDGSYTFESPAGSLGEDKTLEFDYTIKDADGDTSESKLTITIENIDEVPSISIENVMHTTHDDAFDAASSDSDSVSSVTGSFTASGGDVENTITISFGDENIILDADSLAAENGTWGSITTPYGQFTVTGFDAATGEVSYSYEQSGAADHSEGAVQESFTVTVSDEDGNSADDATGTITINIEDDTVTAQDDSVSLKESDITADTLATGNLLDNDNSSADGNMNLTSVTAPEGWTTPEGWTASGNEVAQFESDAGVITFNNDGSYSFTPSDDYAITTDQNFSFGYTIQDGDGSSANAAFDLSIEAEHGSLETNDLAIEVVTLNLAVIVDSSGSMKEAAMDAIEDALNALGQSLDALNDSAVEINLCLIDYNKGAQVQLQVSSDDLNSDNGFENLLSGIEWTGGGKEGTNMDAAFEAATGWFNSLGQDAIDSSINKTIFMTDGQPTYALEDTVSYEALRTYHNDANSTPYQTVTFEGKTYTLESYEVHEYDASALLASDAALTYRAEDGSILTCIQDNGGSGKGDIWLEGDVDVTFDGSGNFTEQDPTKIASGDLTKGTGSTIVYEGEVYTLATTYTHDYNNSYYANDGYSTYVNDSGETITCLHDKGSSGAGDVWYEGEVKIDFSAKGNPSVSSKPLDVTPGDTFSGTVNVQGQTLNSAADIANGADGHTWVENGVEYRLVQSEAENGTAIDAPTLQANVGGVWISVGTVGVISDGSGDYASENEKTHTQESADALNEAMGYTEEGESGLFAVGFGHLYNDSFLKTITIGEQLYNTADLAGTFDEIMAVVAREVALQLEEAVLEVVNEALDNVEGVDASVTSSDISSVIDLAEQGEYELLDQISDSLESTSADYIQDGVTVDINGNGVIDADEMDVTVEFDHQNSQGSDEDDLLVSFGGSDTINAGDGHDVVFGGAGDDELHGGAGDDYLHGGSGNDVIFGGEGNDIIDGGIGSDVLHGGAGDDLIIADLNDSVYGGSGNDTIDIRDFDGSDLDLSNLLIDGGNEEDGTPGMDVLLTAKDTDVESMLQDGTLTNVEVIVQGADDATAKEALESIENGSFDGSGWNSAGSIQGANGTTFDKFESDDGITILVQQTLLNTSTM